MITIGSQTSSSRFSTGATAGEPLLSRTSAPGITASLLASVMPGSRRKGVLAALAQPRRRELGRDGANVPPASLAFCPVSALDRHLNTVVFERVAVPCHLGAGRQGPQFHLGHDEQHRQVAGVALQERQLP